MLKRFILWDFPRASWQYDVMVGIILAFIFLTPREWFRDWPAPTSIVMLSTENGNPVFFVDSRFLSGVPENQRVARLTQELQRRRVNSRLRVTRIEPILDSEGELLGYTAFAKP
ncbi:MAG TPA: hypothetical protein VGF59_23785 [Bryobacteraceae bacterium]|jgi:hypothetical protein